MSSPLSPELLAESKALSEAFFRDPQSYGGFSFTRDHRLIVGCIEPRDPVHTVHGDYKTIMQTGGGFFGEGLDQALAVYADEGDNLTVADGMRGNIAVRPSKAFDVHHDCAFHKSLRAITAEMADPSDFTQQSIDRWAHYFKEKEHIADSLGLLTTAAKVQLELIDTKPQEDLIKLADELLPHHHNVYPVQPVSMARTYVVNLHPHLGKNRNRKPADPAETLKVQGYHDSLAANITDLATAFELSKKMRGMRVTAALLRSAATLTVITQDRMSEMTLLEVRPKPEDHETGLVIEERRAA